MNQTIKNSPCANRSQRVRPSVVLSVLAVFAAVVFAIMFLSSSPKQEDHAANAGGKRNGLQGPDGEARPSGEKKERPLKEAALPTKNAKIRAKVAQEALPSTQPPPSHIDAQVEERIIAEVMQALDNPDEDVRQSALEKLSEMRTASLNAPLQRALRDPSPEVREAALDVIGEIRSPEIIPSLETALFIGDETMRESALDILEDIEDPRSIDVIIESGLKDKSESIREAALKSLEWMTEMEFKSYEDATLWWSANRDQLRF